MSRIAAVTAGLVLVVSLNSATKALGQILTNTSTGTSAEPERQSEAKKKEPNWERMHQSGNAAYLANVRNVQKEWDRFKGDAYWSDALRQMLGTDYSYIGRHQKALEYFDRPRGWK